MNEVFQPRVPKWEIHGEIMLVAQAARHFWSAEEKGGLGGGLPAVTIDLSESYKQQVERFMREDFEL